jgi:polyphosphate kinase
LKKQVESGIVNTSADGYTPLELLAAIRKITMQIMTQARNFLHTRLLPELSNSGIFIMDYKDLDERQKANVDRYFDEVIFPVITPLGFDPGHPFPHISNLSLNLALTVKDERQRAFRSH